jgi:hypothetical protein
VYSLGIILLEIASGIPVGAETNTKLKTFKNKYFVT